MTNAAPKVIERRRFLRWPAYGPPILSHQEIEELSRHVATLRGPERGSRQPEFRDTFPDPVKPKADQ